MVHHLLPRSTHLLKSKNMKETQPILVHLLMALLPLLLTGRDTFIAHRVKTTLVSAGTRHMGKLVSSNLQVVDTWGN